MALVDRSFVKSGGSFALRSDILGNCSSLASEVIEAIFQDMAITRWIEDKWAEVVESPTDAHCTSEPEDSQGGDAGHARMESMSGIFLLHGTCTVLCVVLHGGHLLLARVRRRP